MISLGKRLSALEQQAAPLVVILRDLSGDPDAELAGP
jgi:hypothetical protein